MSPPMIVTDSTFADEVLASTSPVIVEFWANWCGHCEQLAPVLEDIAVEHGDQFTVARLDVDENPKTVGDYQVTSLPTLLVFRGGNLSKQIDGTQSKAALLDELSEFTG